MSDSGHRGTPTVKSAERVLVLVEQLARAARPLTVQELQQVLDIPRSSLHALLATMVRTRWAVQRDSRYALGPAARPFGPTQFDEVDIVEAADDTLTMLRDELQETVHLATLDGSDVLYLTSRFSPHALGVRFQPGRRLPAQITALGKAMLASLPTELLRSHLPEEFATPTPKSVCSEGRLRRQLGKVRKQGHAVDDEETAVGLRCFAVALIIPTLAPHAISCSTPIARLNTSREDHIVSLLRHGKDEILRQLAASQP
ncbi:MAG: IclR family transcriptional regulator [Sciscionella sp.]